MIRVLALLFVSVNATANAVSELDHIGGQLREVRSLPPGTKTDLHCPDDLNQFVGLSWQTVTAALGDPDNVNYDGNIFVYVLRAPKVRPSYGGGHPVLLIHVDSGIVKEVTCNYAE